jgi:hypothetical protein
MTIVAMSIPVLRVFFKHAIANYQSSRSKSATASTPTSSALAKLSARGSSKMPTSIADNFSGDSRADVFGRKTNSYLELDDLAVDEKTGRVSYKTPESVPESISESIQNAPEQQPQQWHLRDQA